MVLEELDRWADDKGILVMGTGDFTHPGWFKEIKQKLEPAEPGLFKLKLHLKKKTFKGTLAETRFILSTEISGIYSKNGKTRRVHNIVFAPDIETVEKINTQLSWIGNLASDGRPILGLDSEELAKIVFNINPRAVIIPAHAWTPWFSLFGSMSGFDRIEDCFEAQTPKIFAIETGLSSDPAMNWRLSALDKITLISNSDSHSPQKIGREANVFDCDLNYKTIREVLQTKDKSRFLYTVEFFPEEGKYHYDGHRLCGINWSPKETKLNNGRCTKCGKPVTIGVMNRVEKLADRPEGYTPSNAIPYKSLVPLDEIIAEAKGIGKASAGVERDYRAAVAKFGTEFQILVKASEQELRKSLSPMVAEGVIRMRKGNVEKKAGFDGEYGVISVFGGEEKASQGEKQLSLF